MSSPQPVYFVAWGTNYYGLNYLDKILYTNVWSPCVLVEIGAPKELLQISVGDMTYYRCPPTLIPSKAVWRLVHTPDPPLEQLRNPAVSAQFFWDTQQTTTLPDYWYMLNDTNGVLWHYLHHQPDPKIAAWQIRDVKKIFSELIPYTNGQ